MANSIVDYQSAKASVDDAILEVKGLAERLEKTDHCEFRVALYDLLEAIDYLDHIFTAFSYDNIPKN